MVSLPLKASLIYEGHKVPKDVCFRPEDFEGSGIVPDEYDYLHYLNVIRPGGIGWFSTFVAFCLIIGTVASTTPQIVKVIMKKSTHGLSAHMLHLAAYNQFTFFINLTSNQLRLFNASIQSYKLTWEYLLEWAQALVLFVSFFIVWTEYLYYAGKEENHRGKRYRNIVICYIVFLIFACISLPAMVIVGLQVGYCNDTFQVFIYAFGIISTVLTIVEWVPQIVHTAKAKDAGSFSVIMIGIQGPACIIVIVNYIIKGVPFSSWFTWIFSAVLELILFGFLVKYTCYKKGYKYNCKKCVPEKLPDYEDAGESLLGDAKTDTEDSLPTTVPTIEGNPDVVELGEAQMETGADSFGSAQKDLI